MRDGFLLVASLVVLGIAGLGSAWLPRPSGSSPGGRQEASLQVRLIDEASGEPTTAMVCLRNLDDGTVRLPPDGRVARRVSRTEDFYRGISRDGSEESWLGPVRMTMGKGDNNDRSYVYGLEPSIPHWREPVMYQTPGEFTVRLPPGRYRLAVSRGMEVIPVRTEFSIDSGTAVKKRIVLARWVDLAGRGWTSGDVHVHHPIQTEGHRRFLLQYAEAEDLHVVNVLEMGHHAGTDFRQIGFGREFRVRQGDHWLVAGQEEPRSQFGHIIGLNISSLARDVATYDFYDLAFDRIHRQKGALVGFAHFAWNGCALPRGFPWYVTTKAIDFVELLQFGKLNSSDYRDYLDLGFELSAAAGSDVPWGSTIGEVRTYVHTGETLDPDAWFEGLERGRTFVSNGPAIELTVDGELPGARLERARGSTVRVRARAWGHPSVGLPRELLVVGTPGVLGRSERAGGDTESALVVDVDMPVEESTWLAARTSCDNGALAHSSPVWVLVDGLPAWNRRRAPEIISGQLRSMAAIEKEFSGREDPRSRGILARLQRAREFYEALRDRIAARG